MIINEKFLIKGYIINVVRKSMKLIKETKIGFDVVWEILGFKTTSAFI